MNGAQLEIGWLPPLLREAHNDKLNPGNQSFLDLSNFVKLIQKHDSVSRSQGDVHPDGNPHFHLDPDNIPILARAIYQRFSSIMPEHQSQMKRNLDAFLNKWQTHQKQWQAKMESLKNSQVIQYHSNMDYFFKHYKIKVIGELEPLPGIPPTSSHLRQIIQKCKTHPVKKIITDVYHSKKPAQFVSRHTGVPLAVLPHDVSATSDAKDIFSLFEAIIERIQ